MTTIELFCASLLINLPVVPTLPPMEIAHRCTSFYVPCVAQKLNEDAHNEFHTSMESMIGQCAIERTDKDY